MSTRPPTAPPAAAAARACGGDCVDRMRARPPLQPDPVSTVTRLPSPAPQTRPARRFLMLHGPSSLFFPRLAAALEARGAEAHRIHLCPGDALYWGRRPRGRSYRGDAAGWPAFLADMMAREGITDLALLGDNRPRHREAVALARATGVRVHHVELGLVRPDWLTIEPNGAGPALPLPETPEAVAALARAEPPEERRLFPPSFPEYAALDVVWNLSNLLFSWATHPHYERHATWHPTAEWAGFLWKLVRARRDRAHAAAVWEAWGWEAWGAGDAPLFLLPLQLRTDFQIRVHGPDPDLRVTMAGVIRDFARNAPPEARLLVKEHPGDNGMTPWRRLLRAEAARHGAEPRVEVIDGGDLNAMLDRAAGVVTVNSTVGLSALRRGVPVKALGRAVFAREGITDPQPLRGFWRAPMAPDAARVADLLGALGWATQVRGGFEGAGVTAGAAAMAERMLAPARLPGEAGRAAWPRLSGKARTSC